MFTNDQSIENIQQLFAQLRKYLELQKEYTRLEVTEKLTMLLSMLILVLVLLVLGIVALFYLSFTLAYLLSPLVGGLLGSYAIITGFILLLMVLIACLRKRLIINPVLRFLAGLFLTNDKENADE
ncbi:MAG: phage holin family protein [Prevotellaceae bacterium]|nr:phage holin family protein [Prevotellaceae bacterium]